MKHKNLLMFASLTALVLASCAPQRCVAVTPGYAPAPVAAAPYHPAYAPAPVVVHSAPVIVQHAPVIVHKTTYVTPARRPVTLFKSAPAPVVRIATVRSVPTYRPAPSYSNRSTYSSRSGSFGGRRR